MNRLLDARRLAPLLITWELSPNVLLHFEIEAKRDGAKFIEAEHMLLALAANPDTEAARVLNASGLDHQRLTAALHEEHRRTLAFAGMNAPDRKLVEATALDTSLSLGTSAKAALRRALTGARHDRRRARLRGIDLLAGIVQAELGTVPRVIAIAGIDRADLIARAMGSQ